MGKGTHVTDDHGTLRVARHGDVGVGALRGDLVQDGAGGDSAGQAEAVVVVEGVVVVEADGGPGAGQGAGELRADGDARVAGLERALGEDQHVGVAGEAAGLALLADALARTGRDGDAVDARRVGVERGVAAVGGTVRLKAGPVLVDGVFGGWEVADHAAVARLLVVDGELGVVVDSGARGAGDGRDDARLVVAGAEVLAGDERRDGHRVGQGRGDGQGGAQQGQHVLDGGHGFVGGKKRDFWRSRVNGEQRARADEVERK